MPKVMLIEDDPTMLSLLNTLMELEGYSAAKLRAAEDYLAEIQAENPDLILLDVNLSGADGIDLLEKLRADEVLKHTLVIMSSGMDYRDVCMEKGADGFILKPYMPDELIALTKQLLGV
jgi:DNA-binding response OmpR family regulator